MTEDEFIEKWCPTRWYVDRVFDKDPVKLRNEFIMDFYGILKEKEKKDEVS